MREEIKMIGSKLDDWYAMFIKMLPNILLAIAVSVGVYFLSKGIKIIFQKYLLAKWDNKELKAIFAKVLQIVIISFGLLFALSIVNLDKTVTSILAGVGIAGIAVGFAFQDIAANFISGLFMASNKPFTIGDVIDTGAISGTVKQLKLRTTVVRTFQGNDVIIPNNQIFQNPLINYSSSPERRIDLDVGVSYGSNLSQVTQLTVEAIKTLEGIMQDKPIEVFYNEFGGSSINFTVRFWTANTHASNFVLLKSQAVEAIKTKYDEHQIDIPFPIRTLDLSKSKEILESLNNEKAS
ncbi:mechanosensitive ion channel family protein [Putridiphycobacter roseus]|uniref:Mechanosensitive ion channel family protein n=1 Tax=Putridiphycobacter roseus TaxID=2219161 RepID=A0A2W1N2N3_9FLAO|nr:mechanosensitive ion channel family protein [Putridiphycobacter roseus]PZE17790.1 mechanosensitive ion channel family protein [Putridiphycobacter roseus]